MLLLRVRDDIKLTNAAYQTLYQSAVTFAMRKQLLAEHGKDDLEKQILELENEKLRHKNKIIELEARIEAQKIRNKEKRVVDIDKRAEEMKFL